MDTSCRIFKRKLYERMLNWKQVKDGKTALLKEAFETKRSIGDQAFRRENALEHRNNGTLEQLKK